MKTLYSVAALIIVVSTAQASYIIFQASKIHDQAITLDIWKNCPMPRPGWWLIVEADWVGKLPTEQLRCGFARQPSTVSQRTY